MGPDEGLWRLADVFNGARFNKAEEGDPWLTVLNEACRVLLVDGMPLRADAAHRCLSQAISSQCQVTPEAGKYSCPGLWRLTDVDLVQQICSHTRTHRRGVATSRVPATSIASASCQPTLGSPPPVDLSASFGGAEEGAGDFAAEGGGGGFGEGVEEAAAG